MTRIIPKSSKVKNNFFKGFSLKDLILITMFVFFEAVLLSSNIHYNWIFAIAVAVVFITALIKIEEQRIYTIVFTTLLHISGKKKFSKKKGNIKELQATEEIKDNCLVLSKYVSSVLEIEPISFSLKSDVEQDRVIERFASCLSVLTGYEKTELQIVKLERPMNFDEYLFTNSVVRTATLNQLYDEGKLTDKEYDVRLDVLANNEELFEKFNEEKIMKEHFYIQCFCEFKSTLETLTESLQNDLLKAGLKSSRLNNEELGIYVKNSYMSELNERDFYDAEDEKIKKNGYTTEEIYKKFLPEQVKIKWNRNIIDDKNVSYLTVSDYPMQVENAWGFEAFHIPHTKATMKIKIRERDKAIKDIDKSIMNLKMYYLEHQKDSERNEAEAHVATLRELLTRLQMGNDYLFDVNLTVTTYDEKGKSDNKKNAKKVLGNAGIRALNCFSENLNAFLADSLTEMRIGKSVGINSSSLAAFFPFVEFGIKDKQGVFIGESGGEPCVLDMFFRDGKTRVNSNAFVVGQSGMGKSYFTKTLMAQLIPLNTKLICFDPESEYSDFVKNVGGVSIDVATSRGGRINPFEVIRDLESDEIIEESNTFYSHLIFLESFFKTIIVLKNEDAFEYLNTLIVETYKLKNIDEKTNFDVLSSKDYPTFEDLFEVLKRKFDDAKSEYDLSILRTLVNHISKFAIGGRYSNLWNGETTLRMDSNFINFDFRALLTTENKTLANAQMMLILRYSNIEVAKNRELNEKTDNKRKIIIVIDESHVFFSKQFTVALNFFEQMARRIRKYYGMIMFTTQNIGDFVASAEIADKTKAIINACQYSFIFGLPANGVTDLVELYRTSKPLNESEIDFVKNAERGEVFAIISNQNRVGMKVVAPLYTQELFGEIKPKVNSEDELEDIDDANEITTSTQTEFDETTPRENISESDIETVEQNADITSDIAVEHVTADEIAKKEEESTENT